MQELINAKIKEITESGKLDEIVTANVLSFVQSTIKDCLSPYSEATKAFKTKINESLIEGFDKLDFVQYSRVLTDLVEVELNKSVMKIGIKPAQEMIKDFVGALEKKEWKLSEIIEEFKKTVKPDEYGESGTIGFMCEKSYGTYWIAFDEEAKSHRYKHTYTLAIDEKEGHLFSITHEGRNLNPLEKAQLYGFDLFLYKLYAMKCKIEVDVDNVDTEWSTYDD